MARARTGDGQAALALAHRDGERWMLDGVFGDQVDPLCEEYPCSWPTSLTPESALVEPPPLSGAARRAVVHARTLLTFEGALNIDDDEAHREAGRPEWVKSLDELPNELADVPDLSPVLEQLRRYHPVGGCSMDGWPQRVAALRALAAARAGRTGWAVQGWMDTVGYFSSPRMAWSSYGQQHPRDHLQLLEMVDVEPTRFFVGALFDLPGQEPRLLLGDARRVAADLGPALKERLRKLASDPSIDPLNRARMFMVSASEPIDEDPGIAKLPPLSRAIVETWLQ